MAVTEEYQSHRKGLQGYQKTVSLIPQVMV